RGVGPGAIAIGEELIILRIDGELDSRVLFERIADDRRDLIMDTLAGPVGDEQECRIALGVLWRLHLGLRRDVTDLAALGFVGIGSPIAEVAELRGLGGLR